MMDTKTAAGALAIVALVAAGVYLSESDLSKTATTDEKTLTATDAAKTRAVKLSDAGVAYVIADADGGVRLLAKAPCAWKPNKTAACFTKDGGDPGVANTLQPGYWQGAGCVRKACVIFAGQPENEALLPVPKLDAAPKAEAPVEEVLVGP
jgi:hypothetical protein